MSEARVEPAISRYLVGFISAAPHRELLFFKSYISLLIHFLVLSIIESEILKSPGIVVELSISLNFLLLLFTFQNSMNVSWLSSGFSIGKAISKSIGISLFYKLSAFLYGSCMSPTPLLWNTTVLTRIYHNGVSSLFRNLLDKNSIFLQSKIFNNFI